MIRWPAAAEIDALEKLRGELHLLPGLEAFLAIRLQASSPAGAELAGLTVATNTSSSKTPATLSNSQKAIRTRLRDRGIDTLLVLRPVDCSLRPLSEKDRGNGAQFLRIEIEGRFIRLHDWTKRLEVTATYEGKARGYRGWILQNGDPLKEEWDAALDHLAGEIAGWFAPAK